mmetsp:Transcript_17448/g.41727  ORF Transcript_17448/g.41727 Transcript_17448/m.41727 type:complete len:240 (+) Transcript_17448:1086-1805(+)
MSRKPCTKGSTSMTHPFTGGHHVRECHPKHGEEVFRSPQQLSMRNRSQMLRMPWKSSPMGRLAVRVPRASLKLGFRCQWMLFPPCKSPPVHPNRSSGLSHMWRVPRTRSKVQGWSRTGTLQQSRRLPLSRPLRCGQRGQKIRTRRRVRMALSTWRARIWYWMTTTWMASRERGSRPLPRRSSPIARGASLPSGTVRRGAAHRLTTTMRPGHQSPPVPFPRAWRRCRTPWSGRGRRSHGL